MQLLSPLTHSLVLWGAGNAHLLVVKKWGMKPLPGVRVSLVNETAIVPYSGMVPGFIAGQYRASEIEIDCRKICFAAGIEFIEGQIERADLLGKRVHLRDRSPLTFDCLSLNFGSQPLRPSDPACARLAIFTKPLSRFLTLIENLEERVRLAGTKPFELAVVGGGAAGCELAFALQTRLSKLGFVRLSLIHSGKTLGGSGRSVSRKLESRMKQRGIAVYLCRSVVSATEVSVTLDSQQIVPCDNFIWSTQAAPLPEVAQSQFITDEKGFIRVSATLQTLSDPAVFAAGDCASLVEYPDLPKAGVYSVREAPVLYENLIRWLTARPLRRFRPQRRYLSILNTADSGALARYGAASLFGKWAFRWKDRIDRAWMEKFQSKNKMANAMAEKMRCGGCGSKIPARVLSDVLSRLSVKPRPEILIGLTDGDDAAVHQPPVGKVEIQTVDAFKIFIDDKFLFGQIAAVNALSDIFAMNGDPFSALAIVSLPEAAAHLQSEWLEAMLAGALEKFEAHGVTLTGGHTSEATQLSLGFSVTGYGEAATLFRKNGLRNRDDLILTKPLGSGALLAALGRGEIGASDFAVLKKALLQSNGRAAKILARFGVIACTDVTGFGLVGHLLEMLDRSQFSATIALDRLPIYPGFAKVFQLGIQSSLHSENARLSSRTVGTRGAEVLYDPQTSGGLLFSIAPNQSEPVLAELQNAGYFSATVIGEIVNVADAARGGLVYLD